ncbi:hypothetical protein PV08_06068 [Exophiala spinifera]|uniref:PXA domain-containing protein n=1 Tax=Exophiala spinifera TaxID=91928 RepID=A0A0D1ZTD9_9EURO|nr:uncharacterized protein PV08_06068 [Exophiala spinifera]KIW16017.1 hypothetical protein PV08_06068 [Exophiala spinifera]
MTATSPSRPPLPPNITTKSSSTASLSQLSVVAGNKTPSEPRASSRIPPAGRRDAQILDPTSESATLSLIRRTLVTDGNHGADPRASPRPIEGILPPLTSSNEVDVQLYAIVAIIIKDFVNSWYSKITPDRTFIDEVIQIIAHCSRALEQRFRQIDVTELFLDELPVLVERHIHAYRTATTAQAALQYGEHPRRIYHSLNPHPALDPWLTDEEQRRRESAYRQLLVQGALAVLLPTEDLANACLRTLVTDIIADLILGQALAEKVCQPWFLHGAVSKLVEIVTSAPSKAATNKAIVRQQERQSRLEKFGLLTDNTADQEDYSSTRHQSSLSAWFWTLLQYTFVAYQSMRFILVGMSHAQTLPPRVRSRCVDTRGPSSPSKGNSLSSAHGKSDPDVLSTRAILDYRIFSCISTILDLSIRMPWLAASLSFWQHILVDGPGGLGSASSTLDKFLYHILTRRVFSPSLLPPLLLQVRATLFPNNSMGPPAPPPPSIEEAASIRSKAARDILSLFPKPVASKLFAVTVEDEKETQDVMSTEIEDSILCWTNDLDLNKYLVYSILEHILLRLVPEMEGKTPSEILADRGIALDDAKEGEDMVLVDIGHNGKM